MISKKGTKFLYYPALVNCTLLIVPYDKAISKYMEIISGQLYPLLENVFTVIQKFEINHLWKITATLFTYIGNPVILIFTYIKRFYNHFRKKIPI